MLRRRAGQLRRRARIQEHDVAAAIRGVPPVTAASKIVDAEDLVRRRSNWTEWPRRAGREVVVVRLRPRLDRDPLREDLEGERDEMARLRRMVSASSLESHAPAQSGQRSAATGKSLQRRRSSSGPEWMHRCDRIVMSAPILASLNGILRPRFLNIGCPPSEATRGTIRRLSVTPDAGRRSCVARLDRLRAENARLSRLLDLQRTGHDPGIGGSWPFRRGRGS